MEVDGKYEGPSVSRGLARSKYKKAVAAKESGGGEPRQEQSGGHEKLAAIHPHAEGATKSFHAYQHPDGKIHAHTHDHQTGKHEHREHPDMHSAAQHMQEHMGGGMAEENPPGMETEAPGSSGGMESMGLGSGPPMGA